MQISALTYAARVPSNNSNSQQHERQQQQQQLPIEGGSVGIGRNLLATQLVRSMFTQMKT